MTNHITECQTCKGFGYVMRGMICEDSDGLMSRIEQREFPCHDCGGSGLKGGTQGESPQQTPKS